MYHEYDIYFHIPSHSHQDLAQLARAPALQAGGQRFESVILHEFRSLPEAFMKEEFS